MPQPSGGPLQTLPPFPRPGAVPLNWQAGVAAGHRNGPRPTRAAPSTGGGGAPPPARGAPLEKGARQRRRQTRASHRPARPSR